ncbi:hypothetical protein VAPA_1c32700 [Variovorax paradoxus B4]|uniref:Uncharacterized protein n=1 Tax=Variovorax paradoxus B4 TaxID=1246301 RepID=T1XCZ2_VARPD|nr:hypothetical protein [Variovorax paradoxus]AGU50356.1 hypothetical protein VAPA_1c32700 [Variovorax paradoxus B4]
MESLTHSDRARSALLQSLALELANQAADALEPHAGQPIGDDARAALAADVCRALADKMPVLVNVRHALDLAR